MMSKTPNCIVPNCLFEFVWNGTVCIATKTNSSGEYIGIELYDYASETLLVYIPFKKDTDVYKREEV
tara:strand:+ start:256 stop:456 length:201 start_codon:yes stop_codon:yes gene_type:complete